MCVFFHEFEVFFNVLKGKKEKREKGEEGKRGKKGHCMGYEKLNDGIF